MLRLSLLTAVVVAAACVPDEDSSPPADGDDVSATLIMNDESGAPECFQAPFCDPLSPDCPATEQCIPSGTDFACAANVEGTEQLGPGSPCSADLACQAGLACLPVFVSGCSGALGCCIALCELDAPQCEAGFSCAPYYSDAVPICYGSVGVCVEG